MSDDDDQGKQDEERPSDAPEEAGPTEEVAQDAVTARESAGSGRAEESAEPSQGSEAADPDDPDSAGPDAPDAEDSLDDDVRHLLRAAMRDEGEEPPSVLEGFQKKVRARSRGKFYAEGWSTSKEPPTSLFLLTTLVMLAIAFAVWAILGPLSGAPKPVDNTPAPVNVLSPVRTGKPSARPVPPESAAPPADAAPAR